MNCARLSVIIAVSAASAWPASASCKAPAERYAIIDLGDFTEAQSDARAVAIDPKGRIIIRTQGTGLNGITQEFERDTRGKAKPVAYAEDGAERQTRAYLGERLRLVDYTRYQTGYVPLELQTLIDRRGAEMSVDDYCPAPETGGTLSQFVISPSSKHAAGLFQTESGQVLARCETGEAAEIVHTRDTDMQLAAINDDGVMTGLLEEAGASRIWRMGTGDLAMFDLPDGHYDASVDGIDAAGNVFVSTTGEVKNSSLRLSADGALTAVDVLPGLGWDIDQQLVGPCGALFGRAFHTNFEAFSQLPPEEQQELRLDQERYMAFAGEREEGMFIWSEGHGGRFMHTVVDGFRDWVSLDLLDVNESGQAVGYGVRENGDVRAILLQPE
ncbi:MAG: hypothetical protein GYB42_03545 [Alphaproteobacteria bacterium]|nr:hypothetical protein [Alphaproteobacteria bacterium]